MASTTVQLQAAFDILSWDAGAILMVFETGDEVYVRAELNTAGQSTFTQTKYTILNWFIKTNPAGTPGAPIDANGVVAVGSTAPSVATDNTTNDTAPEWPTFYRVNRVSDNAQFEFHESELLDLVGANSVRDANDWT